MCKVSGADDYDDDVMLVVVLAKEERNIGKGDGERGEEEEFNSALLLPSLTKR